MVVYSFVQLYYSISGEELFVFKSKNAVFMRLVAFRKRLFHLQFERRSNAWQYTRKF